jgi:Tfp pilus assembly protein PilX
MQTKDERGIALVLALFLMSAMSVLATSMMFLSQTETYASMNYRMMSQSRYAGEAAVQKAAAFLLDGSQYAMPGAGDPLFGVSCNYQVSPVTCNGNPVILSGNTTVQPSNYPTASVQTAFNTAAHGSLTAGYSTVNYSAYAKLLSMQKFEAYGGGESVVQTWEVTGIGELAGARKATVEVMAILETPKVPASSYGAFASDSGCGALTFVGNVDTDSYDSTTMSGGTAPTFSGSGGDVGTNGNLSITGGVDVNGNLYTPRTGVGECEEGGVTALEEGGTATVHGSVVPLPASLAYPTPELPNPLPDPNGVIQITSANVTDACILFAAYDPDFNNPANCSVSGTGVGAIITLDGGATLPNVSIANQIMLEVVAGNPAMEYDFNSISLDGNASIRAKATTSSENVLVNVAGKNPDGSWMDVPIDFTGGTYTSPNCASCSNYDASILQFIYGGDGEVKMTGRNNAAAVLYAPNAHVDLGGTADFYGSMLGKTITNTGGANFYYDRRLMRDFYVAGHPMASTFNWKRY